MNNIEYKVVGVTGDLRSVSKSVEEADYIEFQLDKPEDPLQQVSEYDGRWPLIVSNRPEWAGESASESNRLEELLTAAASESVEMVEIDLETVRNEEWIVEELRENYVDVIVAYCDFEKTPKKSDLQELVLDCDKYGDISKISVFANEREDALLLLECLNEASQNGIRVTGVSLGELGRHTRAIGVFYGVELCYAPIDFDGEPKYGEMELDQLVELLETTVRGGDHVELIDQLKGKF